MKNNGKSPTFKFVSGEERRPSEVQTVSRGLHLPGATHSSADLTWIRKWLEIQAPELSELESVELELGSCCSDLDKQVSGETCRTRKRQFEIPFRLQPASCPFVLDSSRSSFSQRKKNWPERLLPRPSKPQTLTYRWNSFPPNLPFNVRTCVKMHHLESSTGSSPHRALLWKGCPRFCQSWCLMCRSILEIDACVCTGVCGWRMRAIWMRRRDKIERKIAPPDLNLRDGCVSLPLSGVWVGLCVDVRVSLRKREGERVGCTCMYQQVQPWEKVQMYVYWIDWKHLLPSPPSLFPSLLPPPPPPLRLSLSLSLSFSLLSPLSCSLPFFRVSLLLHSTRNLTLHHDNTPVCFHRHNAELQFDHQCSTDHPMCSLMGQGQ